MNRQKQHQHRVKVHGGPYGYLHCVAGTRCNPASHGGVRFVDVCTCGAARTTNSTGSGREERGPWIVPEVSDAA